jgi:hypothetical protein
MIQSGDLGGYKLDRPKAVRIAFQAEPKEAETATAMGYALKAISEELEQGNLRMKKFELKLVRPVPVPEATISLDSVIPPFPTPEALQTAGAVVFEHSDSDSGTLPPSNSSSDDTSDDDQHSHGILTDDQAMMRNSRPPRDRNGHSRRSRLSARGHYRSRSTAACRNGNIRYDIDDPPHQPTRREWISWLRLHCSIGSRDRLS